MANKLKSRRYKKRRVVSSKKRRQPKSRTKSSRTKRYRRKTRITRKRRGGMKRTAPSTPIQEDGEYNGEPVAPRKNRTRAVGDAVVGANLFQGLPGNQENINPQTPIQQENNLFAQGQVTPQGNLNGALDEAYMEAIATPQTMGVRRDLNIEPFGYDEDHNEIIDDEPIAVVEEDYETEEDD